MIKQFFVLEDTSDELTTVNQIHDIILRVERDTGERLALSSLMDKYGTLQLSIRGDDDAVEQFIADWALIGLDDRIDGMINSAVAASHVPTRQMEPRSLVHDTLESAQAMVARFVAGEWFEVAARVNTMETDGNWVKAQARWAGIGRDDGKYIVRPRVNILGASIIIDPIDHAVRMARIESDLPTNIRLLRK
jgi:hypothetical protein